MRYYELVEAILQGASLDSWLGYLNNMLTVPTLSLGENGEKAQGLRLIPASKKIIQQFIDDLEANGPTRQFVKTIENTEIGFTNQTKAFIKQIYKSPNLKAIQVAPGKKGIEKKYWNDGEVAETFLGAALYTRFLSESNIDTSDIVSLMRNTEEFRKMAGGFTGNGKRKANPVNMYAVNKQQNNQVVTEYFTNFENLYNQFPAAVKELTKTLTACVAYVNQSQKVKDALAEADEHPEAKQIFIKTDGISDQKGTKADLEIKIGEMVRLLSLKANDVKQFGQNTGQTSNVIKEFFKSFIPNINIDKLDKKEWDPKKPDAGGWPDMSIKGRNKLKALDKYDDAVDRVYELTGEAYKIAKKQLETNLKDNPSDVITQLYNGIKKHAQGTDENQTLVILNPTTKVAWKELEFGPQLKKALKSFNIWVTLSTAGDKNDSTNQILRVYGKAKDTKAALAMKNDIDDDVDAAKARKKAKELGPKVLGAGSPEMLFRLRSYLQNHQTQRNIVEMGVLLKSIAEVQKINDATEKKSKKLSDRI